MNYPRSRFVIPHSQRGATAVEFSMVALFFFTYLFALFEMSRALYLWNTMTEVTRRAARSAAIAGFDAASRDAIGRHAMFGATSLPMAGNITNANLEIDYLQGDGETPVAAMPLCATDNLINCTANPNGPSCIRFVRVRMCLDGAGSCSQIPYTSITGLENFIPGSLSLPRFTTISPIGSLGRNPSITTTCP